MRIFRSSFGDTNLSPLLPFKGEDKKFLYLCKSVLISGFILLSCFYLAISDSFSCLSWVFVPTWFLCSVLFLLGTRKALRDFVVKNS